MATVLSSFEFGRNGSSRESKHPWTEWLDGQIRQLVKGEDFTSNPATLVMQARKQAKKRGLKVRVSMKDKKAGPVVLQSVKAEGEEVKNPTPEVNGAPKPQTQGAKGKGKGSKK